MSEPRVKEVIKMAGLRKIIADRMRDSIVTYPQASGFTKLDMTEMIKLKNEMKKENGEVTLTALLIKAIAIALDKYPILNSKLIGDEIVLYDSKNIGIGVAAPEGLYVLVVNEVQDKGIIEISKELKELRNKLANKRICMEDMTGSTITLSNLGMLEIDGFTPIINAPESIILGMGKTRKELVVNDDDTTSIRQMATLSITINHSTIDGEPAVRFLGELVKMFKEPKNYLSL